MTTVAVWCILSPMTRGFRLLAFMPIFVGCASLAKDVTNGASNTERELKGERRHTGPSTDADDGGNDVSISI